MNKTYRLTDCPLVQRFIFIKAVTLYPMGEIINATETISDNISQLSATSEQVAAASAQGAESSVGAVTAMTEFTNALREIYSLAEQLQKD